MTFFVKMGFFVGEGVWGGGGGGGGGGRARHGFYLCFYLFKITIKRHKSFKNAETVQKLVLLAYVRVVSQISSMYGITKRNGRFGICERN